MWRSARYVWYGSVVLLMVWFARWAPAEVAFEASLRERVPKLESDVRTIKEQLITVPPDRIKALDAKLDLLIQKLDALEEREQRR